MEHLIHYHHHHKQIRDKIITTITTARNQAWTAGDQWMRMTAHLTQVQKITHDQVITLKPNNKKEISFLWMSYLGIWITSTTSQGMRSNRILSRYRRSVSRWRTSRRKIMAFISNLTLGGSHQDRPMPVEQSVVLHWTFRTAWRHWIKVNKKFLKTVHL